MLCVLLFSLSVFAEKPAVFTDFKPLTETELQSGTIRLFDGGTVYGWNNAEFKNGVLINSGKLADSPLRFFYDGTVNLFDTLTVDNTKYRPQNVKPIFDAKTLNGWKMIGDVKAEVVEGAIHLTNGSGSIESADQYGDFILQLEYKTDKPVNSGVFFRCIPGEKMNGYECQIFNNPPDADYEKFIGTDTGGIFRRQVGRNVGAKDGVWNYLTIVAKGNEIATWVNGIQVTNLKDDRKADSNPRKGLRTQAGTIQFQGHDSSTEIWLKNIKTQAL
ncbi:hypothetical protein FACS189454_04010 [Planctomycetales bacterium]|nr:hypothetical protein FACS189454_04010 [Planctomycetales bacterium]